MPVPRPDQPSWPTHWLRSRQHQTHCIQMDPIYLYMVHSVDLSLGSQITLALAPHQVNHTGMLQTPLVPAILGLPSSEKLEVVKMKLCHHRQTPTHILHPFPPQWPQTKPATAHEAAKSIRSTDDLIKEFPDRFKGIGRSLVNTKSDSITMHIW